MKRGKVKASATRVDPGVTRHLQGTSTPGSKLIAAAIVLAGVLTYANAFSNPFVFDDFGSIVRNTTIRDVSNLRAVFSPPDASAVAGRPLANLAFAINYAMTGSSAFGFRVVNLLLHLTCALLLFAVARRTLERVAPNLRTQYLAAAIALLWVVHPLNSEIVDYLSQRTEAMMAACYLFTLYAGLRAMDARQPSRWLAAGVLSCAAGMACKESMVTTPLIVLIFDSVFLFNGVKVAMRARWPYYAGLASTWLLLVALISSHGSVSSGGFASVHTTTWNYLLNQTVMITRYLRLVVWPTGLVNYYGWTPERTLAEVWPYALFVTALLLAAIVLFIRRPRLGFLGLWVFITLSPASSFAPIAAEVGAERRMYLPLMGIIALIVVGASTRKMAGQVFRPAGVVAAALLAIALATTTGIRNRDYASPLTLARSILAAWPTPNAHQLVGQELGNLGQHEEAIQHLREAVAGYPPARYSLGNELFATGQFRESIDELQQFIREEPHLPPVPQARMLIARAHGEIADSLAAQHAFVDAIPHYRALTVADPANATAWTGLGVALVATGDAAGSADAFRHAVSVAPNDTHMHQNLARALLDQHDVAGALTEAQQAVTLGANDAAAHEILGRVLAAEHRIDEAIREFQRALQIDPGYIPARDALRSIKK